MTLSYAEAMKRKAQLPESSGSSNTSVRKNVEPGRGSAQSKKTRDSRVKTEKTSSSAWHRAPPPSTPAWPKVSSAKEDTHLKQESPQSIRQFSNPRGMAPSSKVPLSQPKKQDRKKIEASRPPGGEWQMIDRNAKQSKPLATSPAGPLANNAKKDSQKDSTTQIKILSKKQKSPKPKPKLKSMSINDLIRPPKKGRATKAAASIAHAVVVKSKTPQELSLNDFPTLLASSQSTHSPSHKERPNWGKAAGPKPSKTTLKPESKATKLSKKRPTKNESSVTQKSKGVPSGALAAMFFKPQDQDRRLGDGDEHDLLRLMQERTVYQKKGRQRVAPRKKKFTALKKKVLKERLNKWREQEDSINKAGSATKLIEKESCSVCLYNFASNAELDDDDEYSEIVDNLKDMATKIGEVDLISVPRDLDRESEYPVFVKFAKPIDAAAAKACWNGLVVGGVRLQAIGLDDSSVDDTVATGWPNKVLVAERYLISQRLQSGTLEEGATEVVIEQVLTEDDYADEDCLDESLSYLNQLAGKFGDVSKVLAADGKNGNVLVLCPDSQSASAIVEGLSRTIISGNSLSAFVQADASKPESKSLSTIILDNLLTEDDLEDEECLDETLDDVKELAGRHGVISSVVVDNRSIKVSFAGNLLVAQNAVNELNGLSLGGMVVTARVTESSENSSSCIYLDNVLTEDDLNDGDCLAESLEDIRNLASKYGKTSGIEVIWKDNPGVVRVMYNEPVCTIERAVKELDGIVVGGMIASTSLMLPGGSNAKNSEQRKTREMPECDTTSLSEGKRKPGGDTGDSSPKKARTGDKAPLYSGDKLIPEFFAECKRVPKVPNAAGAREYAKIANDERVRPLLTEMLSELMRLQKRAIEDKNAKARRRLVMGLREVARGIRAHKVKMVVMANNLDQYGAIDEKLQEIIDLAHSEDVPLFFEFTKRSLGKAIGKSIKVAVIGIQNADGAHQAFKKLCSIASSF